MFWKTTTKTIANRIEARKRNETNQIKLFSNETESNTSTHPKETISTKRGELKNSPMKNLSRI